MEFVKLGNICSIKTGKLDANESSPDGKYPFFTCSRNPLKIDTYSYDCECVLVAGNGDLNVKYYNGKFDAYQRTYIIEVNNKEMYRTKYIYLLIESRLEELRNKSIGGVIKYIKLGDLTGIEVPKISILEQDTIINKISKLSDTKLIKEEQILKFDELKKSSFVNMFGDPEIDNNKDKVELSTVMLYANNGMSRRGNDSSGNIVLRLVELQRNRIDYSNVNRIILNDSEKSRYLLSDGDVLFARVNGNPDNVGRCACFKNIGEDIYHNDHIIRVKFDLEKINPIYLCELLNDEYGRNEFKNKIKTSAGQYTISQDGIAKVLIKLPSIELQNKYEKIVNEIENQKKECESCLDKLNNIQFALMKEYFG